MTSRKKEKSGGCQCHESAESGAVTIDILIKDPVYFIHILSKVYIEVSLLLILIVNGRGLKTGGCHLISWNIRGCKKMEVFKGL